VQQRRADWGVAIKTVADQYGLAFIPLQPERFDFAVPTARLERPAVRTFREILDDPAVRERLRMLGFEP
jgi:putative molybdopterin biosynthesis protein